MLELIVGLIVSFTLLGILIWAIKDGQFEDRKKMMDGLLFDSEEDLRDAVERENRKKELLNRKNLKNNK
jgi:cbb3-type cytochrome oxidase maturation protein